MLTSSYKYLTFKLPRKIQIAHFISSHAPVSQGRGRYFSLPPPGSSWAGSRCRRARSPPPTPPRRRQSYPATISTFIGIHVFRIYFIEASVVLRTSIFLFSDPHLNLGKKYACTVKKRSNFSTLKSPVTCST